MMDDNNKLYGLPYLGIKPTAFGVAPVNINPAPAMPMAAPFTPPVVPMPPKVPASRKPSAVATPMPISNPKSRAFEPMRTTKPPMLPVFNPAAAPSLVTPITPALPNIIQPTYKPTYNQFDVDNANVLGIPKILPEEEDDSIPMSLRTQQMEQPKPKQSFNRLGQLLNKGNMK